MRAKRSVMVGLFVCGACGGEALTPVVKTPPTLASAKPTTPPQSGARWYFPTPASGIKDKLDLGDGSMLLVGDLGRREIVKNGVATDSPILIPDRVIGAWRDAQQQFVVTTDNADVYVAKEPLGPFEVHKGPPGHDKVKLDLVATGKSSAIASLSDGTLLRTADNGVSWKPVDYLGGAKLFGHIANFDMDHAGNGILVRVPQRVYLTHDDGATWKPIAAPALGVRGADDDAGGSFLVVGYDDHWFKVQGDTLVPSDEGPQEMSTLAVQGPPESTKRGETTRLIAGDMVVELDRRLEGAKANQVRVRSTPLGNPPSSSGPAPALTSKRSLDGLAGAWGSTIVVVRNDDDSDENTPTSTVVTSLDGGSTWKVGPTLEGDDPLPREAVTVGPKGWTFIPSLCGNFGEKRSYNCNPAKVRVAGGAAFEDLLFTEEFRPRRFAFDEAHDKVYVIGLTEGGNPTVYESRLSQNKFTPIAKPIKTSYHEHTRITVTADGTLHVFRIDSDKSVLTIERRDAAGKEMPTLYVPSRVEVDSSLQGLSVVGSRGIVVNGKAAGWETNDGGATWTRIAANGADQADCAASGCLMGEAQRVGWDLPMANGATAETVSATTDPPADNPSPDEPQDNASPAPPRMTITCKAAGAMTKIASQPTFDNVNEQRDVYWYIREDKAGKKSLTIGGRAGMRQETLLDAPPATTPKDITRTTGERWLSDGFVTARYTRAPSQPVDVELASFSLETGHVQHATLPKVPSFRVASYGFTGEVQLVTGGLLWQSTDASQAYFVRDGGKVDRMTLPAHATLREAQHVGTAWMLFGTDSRQLAEIDFSGDNGATWQQRAWLVTDSDDASVALIRGAGGRPWISTTMHEGAVLYPVASPPATELATPAVVDPAAMDGACDPKGPYAQTFSRWTHGGTVTATVDLADKKPAVSVDLTHRLMHVTPAGSFCTSGYVLRSGRTTLSVYREGKTMHGWAFQTPDDWKGKNATPVTCTVTQ